MSEDDDDNRPSPLDRLQYLSLSDNRNRGKRSRKQEDRLAKELGGRRLPGSGAVRRSKYATVARVSNVSFRGEELSETPERVTLDGDITAAEWHFEHKSTERDSISIKVEWLDKVKHGAVYAGKTPALIVTFVSKRLGAAPSDWVLIPFDVFKRTWGVKK